MRKLSVFCLVLLFIAGCKKAENGDPQEPGNKGGGTTAVSFKEHAPSTVSSVPVTSFVTNRKGSTIAVSVYDVNNRVVTYAGDGKKWDKLGEFQLTSAVVTESGTVIYFERPGVLKRYTGSGNPETVTALTNINYSRVIAGHDGKVYAGAANSKIYVSPDEGKTWTATDIPVSRFSYNAQLPIEFAAFPGKMYSYSDKQLFTSADEGKTWTRVPLTIDFTNSGFTDRYAPVSQDLTGHVYIRGADGVTILDLNTVTSKSIAFRSAGLKANSERFAHFTSDGQGNVYGSIHSAGYDYEYKKSGGSIFKFSGGAWKKMTAPSAFTGFNNMPLYSTEAGVISSANGLLSKGLYSLGSNEQLTAIGTPETIENTVSGIAPHTNGKVFAVVRHDSRSNINPQYPVLMVAEGGQWKHTGITADEVFVASSGDIYAIHSREVSLSKDGGTTWQTAVLTIDDPLNLRNFLYGEALNFTELKGEIHVYMGLAFGGVNGAYVNYAWTKAPAGTTNFDRVEPRPGAYRPDSKQVPLVTAAKGTTGFYYRPFNSYEYYPAAREDVFFTKDGGVSYQPVPFPLPFAGSSSGSFVAYGGQGFMSSSPAQPTSFTAIELKMPWGSLDMNRHNGANYFRSWGRFSPDNKLYITDRNAIYVSDKAF